MHGEPVWERLHLTFLSWHDWQAPAVRFLFRTTAVSPDETGILNIQNELYESRDYRQKGFWVQHRHLGVDTERRVVLVASMYSETKIPRLLDVFVLELVVGLQGFYLGTCIKETESHMPMLISTPGHFSK